MEAIDATAQVILDCHLLPVGPDISIQNGKLLAVVGGLKGGSDNVEGLLKRTKSSAEDEREKAENALDIVSKATFIVMRYGADDELRKALVTPDSIEQVLPPALKGLGERIMGNIVDNTFVLAELKRIDTLRANARHLGAAGGKLMVEQLTDSAERILLENEKIPTEQEDERELALALIGTILVDNDDTSEDRGSSQNNSPQEEYLEALKQYEIERGKLQQEMSEVSLGEWVDAQVAIKAPRERAPQIWEYQPPEWMPGVSRKEWRKILSMADGILAGVYQKQHDTGYNNSLEMLKKTSMSLMTLAEEDFKFIYEHEVLKGYEVGYEIFHELFVPKVETESIDGENKTVTTFVFPYSTGEDGKNFYTGRVKELADNRTEYKNGLAQRLVEKGVFEDVEAAKLSVALMMDMFEIGGVFSSADVLRKVDWEADAVRLAQRPIKKFNAKIGEMWGGTWNSYCKAVSQGDTKQALQVAEQLGIIPKLLAGSFLDVRKVGKKSLAESIYDGDFVQLKDVTADMYFGWRKDSLNAAAEFLMYLTKEKPLQFKSFAEPDNVISDWIGSLFNDIQALRGNGVSLLTTEAICGAFGGSVGIWPFEGPYFRVSSLNDPKRHLNYFSIGTEVVRQLGLSVEGEKRFLNFFGIDRRYFVDFNDKMADYSVVLNPNAAQPLKDSMYTKGALLKKRR